MDQAIYHDGPVIVWLSPAAGSNITTYDGSGPWAKIWELGAQTGNGQIKFPASNQAGFNFQIPSCTRTSRHVLSVEWSGIDLLVLHGACCAFPVLPLIQDHAAVITDGHLEMLSTPVPFVCDICMAERGVLTESSPGRVPPPHRADWTTLRQRQGRSPVLHLVRPDQGDGIRERHFVLAYCQISVSCLLSFHVNYRYGQSCSMFNAPNLNASPHQSNSTCRAGPLAGGRCAARSR